MAKPKTRSQAPTASSSSDTSHIGDHEDPMGALIKFESMHTSMGTMLQEQICQVFESYSKQQQQQQQRVTLLLQSTPVPIQLKIGFQVTRASTAAPKKANPENNLTANSSDPGQAKGQFTCLIQEIVFMVI
ncbi:hypothetical protein WICMUC_002498 [Wickerhamomyces mucosus]|uniref:Uncharacterized protein n=1 Tax=Wickerhamomyces mucosus TaxID=1378264 RepID=A0A9P8PQN0_9ASCO|nr:hypothetical protein WICMUC_002498 [Wickerhamomyces mucosus]